MSSLNKIVSRIGANRPLLALQIFNGIRFGALILVSVFLANWADTQTIYEFESLVLVGSAFSFFFVSGMSNSLFPFYNSKTDDYEQRKVFPSSLLLLLLYVAVSIGLILTYNATMNESSLREITNVYSIFLFFNLLSIVGENLLIAIKRYRLLLWYGLLSFAAYVFLIAGPIYYGQSMETVVYLLILLGSAKLVLTLIFIHLFNGWAIDKKTMVELARYTAPVMLSLFLANAYIYFNSFFVKEYYSEREFNLFRYGTREFPLFVILANSFSTIQSGFLADKYAKQQDFESIATSHRQDLKRLMHQLFPIAIILILIARPLFAAVLSETFVPAADIFIILLFSLQSRILFPQTFVMAISRTKHTLIASTFELIVGIVLCFIFSAIWGLKGIALGMVVASLVDKIVLSIQLKTEGIAYFKAVPLMTYFMYSGLMLIAYLLVS